MEIQELQNTLATVIDNVIAAESHIVQLSRAYSALRLVLRESVPDFEKNYLKHFGQPEQQFEQMRKQRLADARTLSETAKRLRA